LCERGPESQNVKGMKHAFFTDGGEGNERTGRGHRLTAAVKNINNKKSKGRDRRRRTVYVEEFGQRSQRNTGGVAWVLASVVKVAGGGAPASIKTGGFAQNGGRKIKSIEDLCNT